MNEDKDFLADQAHLIAAKAGTEGAAEADAEGKRIRKEFEDAVADPAAQAEWIRQSNLIYGGLAGAGLVVVQPFLTEDSLDTSATVCVIAIAISIPLLAALLVLNRQEEFRRRASRSRPVSAAKAIAQGSAFTGLTAAFWHMSTVAGIAFLATGCVAVGVHSSGYMQLEYDSKFRPKFRRKTPDGVTNDG
ncbi:MULTISPECIES: hypothetical protein [unclassified Kribbella]|uniref:hypothetical protein n=1 Tax=unclassified Kribbella TaxID=2644121 RepID=UPI00301A6BCD